MSVTFTSREHPAQAEVKLHEPSLALDGGSEDGVDCLVESLRRRRLHAAPRRLHGCGDGRRARCWVQNVLCEAASRNISGCC